MSGDQLESELRKIQNQLDNVSHVINGSQISEPAENETTGIKFERIGVETQKLGAKRRVTRLDRELSKLRSEFDSVIETHTCESKSLRNEIRHLKKKLLEEIAFKLEKSELNFAELQKRLQESEAERRQAGCATSSSKSEKESTPTKVVFETERIQKQIELLELKIQEKEASIATESQSFHTDALETDLETERQNVENTKTEHIDACSEWLKNAKRVHKICMKTKGGQSKELIIEGIEFETGQFKHGLIGNQSSPDKEQETKINELELKLQKTEAEKAAMASAAESFKNGTMKLRSTAHGLIQEIDNLADQLRKHLECNGMNPPAYENNSKKLNLTTT